MNRDAVVTCLEHVTSQGRVFLTVENESYFGGMLPDCIIAQVTPLNEDTDHPVTSERPEVSGVSVDEVGQHHSSTESDR